MQNEKKIWKLSIIIEEKNFNKKICEILSLIDDV